MHEFDYVHRDLKPENILIKEDLFKIADFGFVKNFEIFGKKAMNTILGTEPYMAPEIHSQNYDHKVQYLLVIMINCI